MCQMATYWKCAELTVAILYIPPLRSINPSQQISQSFILLQMELHQQEECPKAVRACPFAEFGCDFKVSVPQGDISRS